MVPRRKFITTVCKKLGMQHAELVTGFEMDQLMWHPVKTKLLVYRADVERLEEAYRLFMEDKERKR